MKEDRYKFSMNLYLSHNSNLAHEFEYRISELSQKISKSRQHIHLYSGLDAHKKSFDFFQKMPQQQQEKILNDFKKYQAITESILDNHLDVSNKSSLWLALKMFGIPSPTDDLFSQLEEGDVIEIYRNDGIQVFRNLNFHDICSYELPELFIYKWDQLYFRKQEHSQMVAHCAYKIFSGEQSGLLDFTQNGSHFIYELFSPKKLKLKIQIKYFYPLKNKSGQIEYGICVSKVNIEETNYTLIDA